MNKVPPVFDKPIGLSNQPQHNSLYSTFDNNAYAIGSGMGRALSNRAGAIDYATGVAHLLAHAITHVRRGLRWASLMEDMPLT